MAHAAQQWRNQLDFTLESSNGAMRVADWRGGRRIQILYSRSAAEPSRPKYSIEKWHFYFAATRPPLPPPNEQHIMNNKKTCDFACICSAHSRNRHDSVVIIWRASYFFYFHVAFFSTLLNGDECGVDDDNDDDLVMDRE